MENPYFVTTSFYCSFQIISKAQIRAIKCIARSRYVSIELVRAHL